MRLALISDIHGDLKGLRAAMARINAEGVDAVYALGDMIGVGPEHAAIFDYLVDHNVQMVRGNWEDMILDIEATIHLTSLPELARGSVAEARAGLRQDHLDLMSRLPMEIVVEPEAGHRAFLCHAAPGNTWSRTCRHDVPADALRQVYGATDADVIAYGHYHGHHVIGLDGKLLVNVASIGLRDDDLAALTFVEYSGRWTVRQWLEPCKRSGFGVFSRG